MTKLVCPNKDCESNVNTPCNSCSGRGVNNRGSRCLDCNGEKFETHDDAFILVVNEMTLWDFELDPDGEIHENLTSEVDEDNHATVRIEAIKCRHCDEDIPIPEEWKKKNPDLYHSDEKFAEDCRGNGHISLPDTIGDET